MVKISLGVVSAVLMVCRASAQGAVAPLSIESAIQTTRAMTNAAGEAVIDSPDGRRYAMMLVRGDVPQNGVEVEIVVGGLQSARAARPRSIAKLFTSGLGQDPLGQHNLADLTINTLNAPIWLDNDTVAFFWADDKEVRQVVSLNVNTDELLYLTHHATDVTDFRVGPGGTMLYRAVTPYSPAQSQVDLRDGYSVVSPDADSLFVGVTDGTDSLDLSYNGDWFLIRPGDAGSRQVLTPSGRPNRFVPLVTPQFSPDGRFVLVDGTAAPVPEQWFGYSEPSLRLRLADLRISATAAYGRQLQQLFVVDVNAAVARPLWDAPNSPSGGVKTMAWSADGSSLLLGPTFLPISRADAAGLEGTAIAIVDVRTGEFSQLSVSSDVAMNLDKSRWINADAIELRLVDGQRLTFEKRAAGWVTASSRAAIPVARPKTKVELRQGPNSPPKLCAVEFSSNRCHLVLDLNPRLTSDFKLGRVEMIRWHDDENREWKGRLFYPANYRPNVRYPLVIQTNWDGDGKDEDFTLYGMSGGAPALGPGFSAFIAQPLAGNDVAVLQGGVLVRGTDGSRNVSRLERMLPNISAYAAAAEYLSWIGLVDRERVGLMGYSNRGWHVEYALSFSYFPYAAAVASDNISAGYLQAAFGGWGLGLGADLTGDQPFAQGFEAWLENSPTFNAHRVRAPLMLQVISSYGGLAAPITHGWESFSRLRYLKKPVELYVAPNILRGSHGTQNPAQILGVQRRTLDWWLFWLKNEEDHDPKKARQYATWRQLRSLHEADLQTPRPPLLDWSVRPRSTAAGGG
jgi:dipeptidyl aminopeptidase/acylaminoacyl peptidase